MTTLIKRDGIVHIRINANGRSKYISTGCATKAEAERVVSQSGVNALSEASLSARLTQRAIGQILTGKNLTCAKALDSYRELKLISRSPITVANNVGVITNWLNDTGLATTPPSAVTAGHIAGWINNPASEWKRNTRSAALASLRGFFDFCGTQGWIVTDPSRLVELDYNVMTHEQKEGSRRQPFSRDEIKSLLAALRRDWDMAKAGKHELFQDGADVLFWFFAAMVGCETGLRLSDVASLEWRCFEEPGKLVVWTGKTDRRMEYEIGENIQNLVGELPVQDTRYVFPEQMRVVHDPKRRAGLSVQFARLLERLKIKGRSYHSLRHSRATQAYQNLDKDALAKKLAESMSIEQIKAMLGHASSQTTKGYLHQ
jgi:integrase